MPRSLKISCFPSDNRGRAGQAAPLPDYLLFFHDFLAGG